ncbi:MAG TPA: hypothetical protein VKY65_16715 [Alphaproteobacteria bacterium]|nr:hypothetical protein [Alphaproteobacteria bacterium]
MKWKPLALALMLAATFHFARTTRAVYAKPPENADPALAPWFQSLRQPGTGFLCCSISDCRPTDSRIKDGHYEAWIDHKWISVPADKILQRTDNPTGQAVVCWTPRLGILCFVPGAES